jgi:ABC-type sugar transport system substrate-binding protein
LKLKEKNPQMDFYFASYDLEPDSLTAIQTGAANIAMGQGPYLQGYLPMMAMFEHLLNGNPMAEGWADPGQEVVTAANVEDFISRETNFVVEYDMYKEVIDSKYTPIWEKVRPWDEFVP